MFSSIFITTLITAVTGNFIATPMCQDFLCHKALFNSETFRICQQIGCYNENPRTYPPPITSPPVNYPTVNYPPVDYPPGNNPPGNIPPGNYPPGNIPPGNIPPGNIPPGIFPPGNIPPGNFPPGNIPPGNYPPGNIPPGNIPPGIFPPGNFPPGNIPPGNFPPGNFPPSNSLPGNSPSGNSPPGNFPPGNFPPGNSPPGNFPPGNFPPGNFPPGNFPPGNFPPVDFPPVNAQPLPFGTTSTPFRDSAPPYSDRGPFSPPPMPPSTFPQTFPPRYPPVPSMPATNPNNGFPPYAPGPYSPPTMQPSVPFVPQAPTTGPNNMIPPYYGYYPSNSWFHHSAPATHVNIPSPIKKEAANLTSSANEYDSKWILKGLHWPGWEIVARNYAEVKSLHKDLKTFIKNTAEPSTKAVLEHFKKQNQTRILVNLRDDFNNCSECEIALSKWYAAVGFENKHGIYFKAWLNNFDRQKEANLQSNNWNSQNQQSNYNPSGFYGVPYQMYPYSVNNPHYYNSNPYAQDMTSLYGSWALALSYPLTSMSNSLLGTIYPNVGPPYSNPHQHQWQAPTSYSNSNSYFDATSQVAEKPVAMIQQNSSTTNTNPLNVSVIFDLRQFNVSQCTITVTKQHPVTLETLLTKAAQTNSCFAYTTVIYINNAQREGKYLDSINGIAVTDTTTWTISKQNGATDLNLDFEPTNGDYFIINNTSV